MSVADFEAGRLANHDREVVRHQREVAWQTSVLAAAVKAWEANPAPLSMDMESPPPAWTREQKDLTWEVAKAWRDLAFTHSTYQGLLQSRNLLYPDAGPVGVTMEAG